MMASLLSAPWVPISVIPLGAPVRSASAATDRPEMITARTAGRAASCPRADSAASCGAALAGLDTIGERVPSKSDATSSLCGAAATVAAPPPGRYRSSSLQRGQATIRPLKHIGFRTTRCSLRIRNRISASSMAASSVFGTPSTSYGLTIIAALSCSAAPANSLRTSTPSPLTRQADVLLRDEVHAVSQRGDQHDVGCDVVAQ